MRLFTTLNPEHVSDDDLKNYRIRHAARAVVLDKEKKVALLHVSNEGYYKLPGGGVEEGEDTIEALRRECREEIGCDIEVVGEVGSIVEYRKIFQLKQTSYCFLAKVVGEKNTPAYTEKEIRKGFMPKWLSFEEAEKFLEESRAISFEGKAYIVPRDRVFLKEARNWLMARRA